MSKLSLINTPCGHVVDSSVVPAIVQDDNTLSFECSWCGASFVFSHAELRQWQKEHPIYIQFVPLLFEHAGLLMELRDSCDECWTSVATVCGDIFRTRIAVAGQQLRFLEN